MPLNRKLAGAAAFVAAGLCLYLPLLSRHYDLNGLAEARAFDIGVLFSQNHMLYRPFAFLVKSGLQLLGISLSTVTLMQITTAVSGSITLGVVYWALIDLTEDWKAAATGTAWLAISFSFWYFSTDISYIVPASMFVAAALAFAIRLKSPFLTGLMAAMAILFWQANLFLLPFLILAPFALRPANRRETIRYLWICSATCAVAVIGTYTLAAIFAMDRSGIREILLWAANYGGGHLSVWGQFGLERIGQALHTAEESILPMNTRLGIGELANSNSVFARSYKPALIAFIGLGVWPLIHMLLHRKMHPGFIRALWWMMIGYVGYLSFIAWWDPAESKWFVVPNIFIAGVLAALWRNVKWTRLDCAAAVIGILCITYSNFSSTIRPRRFMESPAIQIAKCVADHMNQEDLYLAQDWAWDGYLTYFYHRNVDSILGLSADIPVKNDLMDMVKKKIARVQEGGGVVYVTDPDSYAEGYLSWLKLATQWTRADLEQLKPLPAFTCTGMKVKRLALLPGVVPVGQIFSAQEVHPNDTDSISVAEPSQPDITIGYGTLSHFSGQASMIFSRNKNETETVLSATPAVTSGIAYIENDPPVNTVLSVANPGKHKAKVHFSLRDERGNEVDSRTLSLSPGQQSAHFVTESPYSFHDFRKAALIFHSTQPVVAIAMRTFSPEKKAFTFSNLPLYFNNSRSNPSVLLLPPMLSQRPHTDELVLLNPGSIKINGSIADDKGYIQTCQIPANSFWSVSTDKRFQSSKRILLKSSTAEEAAPLLLSTILDNHVKVCGTTIPAAAKGSSLRTFIEFSDGANRQSETSTLLEIYNPAGNDTKATFRIRGMYDGGKIAEASIRIPGGGQVSIDLTKIPAFSSLEKGFFGILEILTHPQDEIYAQAYRIVLNPHADSLVNPINMDPSPISGTGESYFPFLAVGDGYAFRFLFSRFGEETSAGMLKFFNPKGQPLTLRYKRAVGYP